VKRANNANTATPTVTDVTPPGLNGGTSSGGFVRCIAVDPTNSNKALLVFGNYNFQSLWHTTNGGTTWTDVEGNLAGPSGPSVRFASIFYIDGTPQVYLGTSIGLLSTNTLNSASTVWVQEAVMSMGNIIVGWLDYRASDMTLAVGTHSRGVWTGKFTSTNEVGEQSSPTHFVLRQNYPNPFNPATTISFVVGRSGFVSLKVFDVTGKEVATLVSEQKETGEYTVPFDASGLSSGIYLYSLRSSDYTASNKMVLMK
jgi:hypothetical protein